MKYILIIIIWGQFQQGPVTSSTAEFKTLAACQAAASILKRENSRMNDKRIQTTCVGEG